MPFYSRVGNFAAIGWCSLAVGLLGLIFMISGAVITGIAYTEITPPNYDENYDRYLGASVPRLIGKKLNFQLFTNSLILIFIIIVVFKDLSCWHLEPCYYLEVVASSRSLFTTLIVISARTVITLTAPQQTPKEMQNPPLKKQNQL